MNFYFNFRTEKKVGFLIGFVYRNLLKEISKMAKWSDINCNNFCVFLLFLAISKCVLNRMAGIWVPWRKPVPFSPLIHKWGFLSNVQRMKPALPVGDSCLPASAKHCQSLPGSTHRGCTLTSIYVSTATEKKQLSSHLGTPSHPCNAGAAGRKGQEPHLLSPVTTTTQHTTPRAPLLQRECCRVPQDQNHFPSFS